MDKGILCCPRIKRQRKGTAWLAPSVVHVLRDFRVLNLSLMLGVERISQKKRQCKQ